MTDEIARYDCELTSDFYENSYATMTQYQLGEYVRFEDHVEAVKKLVAPQPEVDLAEFEARIKEDTEWWMSKQGTTCELAMSYENIQAKMEILEKYSQMMDDGVWTVRHCETCKGHHYGTRNLHAMIWRSTY